MSLSTVDEYIEQFPPEVQLILHQIRAIIKEEAPEAQEKISYGIPGYMLNGGLIYFAGYKKYISIYPLTAGMEHLEGISAHKGTRATIHFPLNQPIPFELIREIVNIRVAENAKSS